MPTKSDSRILSPLVLYGLLILRLIALPTAVAALPAPAVLARGAIITVDTFDDELDDGAGDCSLREAVQAVNTGQPVDGCPAGTDNTTIILPAGTYTLTLTGSGEDANASGDLDILTGTVTISGAGAADTIIDGNQLDRVLHIHSGASVDLQGVRLTNGQAPDGLPGGDGEDGGGIYNAGGLTLDHSSVISNAAGAGQDPGEWGGYGGQGGSGGGIYNTGALTVTHSTVGDNAAGAGGGIYYVGGAIGGGGGRGGGIYSTGSLVVLSSTIRSNAAGDAGHGGPLGGKGGSGGGIYSTGTLTVTHSAVISSTTGAGGGGPSGYAGSGGDGGGLYNSGTAAVTASAVRGNVTGKGGGGDYGNGGGRGGGVYNSGSLTVDTSTVSHNTTGDGAYSHFGPYLNSGGSGGGIYNGAVLLIARSTIAGNTTGVGGADPSDEGSDGGHGGGIYSRSALTVTLCTISGNLTGQGSEGERGNAGYGGGIHDSGVLVLDSSTVSDNAAGRVDEAGFGGGLYAVGAATVKNTILAGNRDTAGAGDCYGAPASLGYNLVQVPGSCTLASAGDITNVEAGLGPLAENGGATFTHALLPGSPAIDQGSCSSPTDQRGLPRPADLPGIANADDGCDVGAYEYQVRSVDLWPSKAVDELIPHPGQRVTYTIVVRNVGVVTATGVLISDPIPDNTTLAGPVTLDPPGAGVIGTAPTLASDVTIHAGQHVTLSFPITVYLGLAEGTVITNTVAVTCTEVSELHTAAVLMTVRYTIYLPLAWRDRDLN